MNDQLPTIAGAAGSLVVLFTALWRGWLVTGPQVDKLTKRYDNEIERLERQWTERLTEARERERAVWVAHDRQAELARVSTAQTGELMQSFGVLEQYIRATPAAIARLAVPLPEQTEGKSA